MADFDVPDGKPTEDRRLDVPSGLPGAAERAALVELIRRPPRRSQTIARADLGPPGPASEQNRIDLPAFPDRGGWGVVDVRGPR
jgi:hypothetical protein